MCRPGTHSSPSPHSVCPTHPARIRAVGGGKTRLQGQNSHAVPTLGSNWGAGPFPPPSAARDSYLGISVRHQCDVHDVIEHHPGGEELGDQEAAAGRAQALVIQAQRHRVGCLGAVVEVGALLLHLRAVKDKGRGDEQQGWDRQNQDWHRPQNGCAASGLALPQRVSWDPAIMSWFRLGHRQTGRAQGSHEPPGAWGGET